MRAFAAIAVPPETLAGLPGRPERHLTLRFWAELPEERVRTVEEALTSAARASAPFTLELRGLSTFPANGPPRVLWVGTGGGSAELRSLHAGVEAALQAVGFSPEPRGFTPHVTILRVRSAQDRERAQRIRAEHGERSFASVPVRSLDLYASRLRPEGAEHTQLLSAPLGDAASGEDGLP